MFAKTKGTAGDGRTSTSVGEKHRERESKNEVEQQHHTGKMSIKKKKEQKALAFVGVNSTRVSRTISPKTLFFFFFLPPSLLVVFLVLSSCGAMSFKVKSKTHKGVCVCVCLYLSTNRTVKK